MCDRFAERLREARLLRGETQVEAAGHIGIASATLSVLERRGNIETARFQDILAVCRYYGWPLEEVAALCFGEQEEESEPVEVSLLLRALPAEKREFMVAAVKAMARGLASEA